MTNRESILPVDAFSTGLSDEELRGLASRHSVAFEITPNQITRGADRDIVRHGWVIDMYGRPSKDDASLSSERARDHIWEVLRVIARAALPSDEGPISIDVESYSGRTVMDPKRDFLEEVTLRVIVQLETSARMSKVGGLDTDVTDDVSARLVELGARKRH